MKAKWSGIGIVSGRGAIGGTVMARNRNGAYARVKVSPVNPQSTEQTNVRALFGLLAQEWRTLTEGERDEWNSSAVNFPQTDVFGDQYILSGFNLYMMLNQVMQILGNALLTSPPQPGSTFIIQDLSLDSLTSAGAVELSAVSTLVPADKAVLVYATPPLSVGKSFVSSEYRLITTIGPAGDFAALGAEYVAKFGNPVAGMKSFIKIVPADNVTGQESPGYEVSAIAT